MSQVQTFAGAGTVENVLSGQRYERPPCDCIGRLLCTGSVAKAFQAELNVGGVSISPPALINSNNRPPLEPDDLFIGEFEAPEGKEIQLRVVATGAGDFFWRVELEEAVRMEN